MTAFKSRKLSSKLALKTGVILVISAVGVAAVGCSSDSDDSPAGGGGKSNAGAGGKVAAGAGAGGKASAGSSSGGADNAGAPPDDSRGGSDDQPPPVTDGGATGEGGEGGEGNVEVPFSAHLSPTATPKLLDITTGGHDRFYGVTFDADGNIYAVGVTAPGIATTTDFATVVAKFSPAGVLDPTFGVDGYAIRNVAVGAAGELARSIVIQPDGKIVISASVEHVATGADARDRDIALLRYLPTGKKDTTFGVDGIVTVDLSPGALLANGTTYLADSVWGMDMYPDGRLVLSAGRVTAAATDTDFAILRLSKDGVPDETFGTHGVFTLDTLVGDAGSASNNASPRNVTILPGTQGIIGAGYQPVPGFDTKPCVYHVTDAGKLDTTFGVGGVFSEAVYEEQTETYAAVPQSTGKLITTGYARELSTEKTGILSMRLNANGKRDLTYGTDGAVKIDVGGFGDNSRKLVVLPNDHIVLVGGARPTAADVDGVVVALDQNGKPETTFSESGYKTFDLGGLSDFFWGVAVSPSKTSVAVVGIKSDGTTATVEDSAVLLVMKLVP